MAAPAKAASKAKNPRRPDAPDMAEVPAALTEDDQRLNAGTENDQVAMPDAPFRQDAHLELHGAAAEAAAEVAADPAPAEAAEVAADPAPAEAVAEVAVAPAEAPMVEVEVEVENERLDDEGLKRKMHSAFWLQFIS